jgi:glycerate kinase
MRAKAKGVPVLGLSGSLGTNALDILNCGISSLMTTINAPMTLQEALEHAEELYYEAAIRMFRFVKTGMDMKMN